MDVMASLRMRLRLRGDTKTDSGGWSHSVGSFSVQALFNQVPNYERAIQAGKDACHLWFALRDWRSDDPEGYSGDLGAWG